MTKECLRVNMILLLGVHTKLAEGWKPSVMGVTYRCSPPGANMKTIGKAGNEIIWNGIV
jgi:hypothetical protein